MKPSSNRTGRPLRAMLLIPALAAGIGLAAWLVSQREPPPRDPTHTDVRAARVITASTLPVRPSATGYGIVRPGETWQAVAKVSGTVVYKHEQLQSGTIIAAGTRLLEIDPVNHELAIAEAESTIAAFQAERDLLDIEAANTEASLAIERERLTLAERELTRIRSLARQGTTTAAQLDEQEKATLSQRLAIQALENQLRLFPARQRQIEAELARARSHLTRARNDLADTVMSAPMDLRPAEVLVERQQFVGTGQLLFTADSVATAEVAAQVPIEDMRRLVGSVIGEGQPATVNLAERLDVDAIDVRVELVSGGGAVWPARVTRVESGLDPRTRTAQVVVVVDDPYLKADPPLRPPLVRNMYVRVHFAGRPVEAGIALPASAVHDERVYVLDADDRLRIRPVTIAFRQGAMVVLESGVEAYDRVVVDDLVPAIEGMVIAPQPDLNLQAWLTLETQGPAVELEP